MVKKIKHYSSIINEQGVYALANFLTTILLAQWLGFTDFGYFTSGYSIILLAGTIQSSVIIEPMLVFSEKRYKKQKHSYINAIALSNLILSLFFSLVLFGASGTIKLFGSFNELSDTLYYYSLALPLILLLLLTRKICLSYSLINYSAFIGYFYIVGTVFSFYFLQEKNLLSIKNAIITIGTWSLISSLLSILIIRTNNNKNAITRISQKEIFLNHKNYIKWSLPTSFLSWIPGNIYFIFLSLIGKSELSGLLKTIINIITPITQINISLGNIFTKEFSEKNPKKNIRQDFLKRIKLILIINATLALGLLFFGEQIFNLTYKEKLHSVELTLWILCLFSIVQALLSVTIAFFRAQEDPKEIFFSFLISGLISSSAGIYASYEYGAIGALFAMLFSYLIGCIYLIRKLNLEAK